MQVRRKHPNDFVTQVDLASQQAIASLLLGAFPNHALRGEESQQLLGAAGADHVWIVDPLDGTTNFIHGYPAYAVSIALAVRGSGVQVPSGPHFHNPRSLLDCPSGLKQNTLSYRLEFLFS